MFVKGRGCGNGEGDGAGELWYNIIIIGWPSQGSTCYCLFNLTKTACKNRRAAEVFSYFVLCVFYKDAVEEFCFEAVTLINIQISK